MEKKSSNNDLLCNHGQDCILADTIYYLISNPWIIYSPNDAPQPRSPPEQAAASPPLSTSNNTPTQQSPSHPRPVSPAAISYAAVAARRPPTLSPPSPSPAPSKPSQSLTSTPASTQTHRHSQHRSPPVFSIHDLERRFQNKSSPFSTQHSNQRA